jgi:hypothetical protein
MYDKLTALQRHLELKYEGHDFKWRESGSKRIIGLCPEHPDKNPSFNIFRYNDKSYYKCFSCGLHGSLYDFIQEGITPEQKEKYALNKQNQKRLWESFAKMKDYLLTADTVEAVFARKYLAEKRFLDMSTVKKSDIGLIAINEDYGIDDLLSGENKISNYRGWLVFPHTNIKGDICRLKFREPDGKNIRTANIKGCEDEPAAFGLKGVGGGDSGDYPVSPYIYITEGEFNYLQYLNSAGLGNVVSAGGKDNISLKLINTFLSLDFVPVVALDQDNAGKRQLRKIYEQTPAGNREKIVYCEYGGVGEDGTLKKDFDDIFKNKNSDGVNEVLSDFKFKTLENLKEILEEENFKKKERIEKFIEDNTQGEGLKEIYFDKYGIKPKNANAKFNFLFPSQITAERASFLLDDFMPLPVGAATIISSRGGSGKSALALQLALRASARNINTLAWLSEDPIGMTKHRLEKISRMTGISINNQDNLILCGDMPFYILMKNNKNIMVNTGFYDFKAACKKFKIVIIDPLIGFYGGDENDNAQARYFMDLLGFWAKEENKSIVIVHHQTKYMDVSIARGASAFVDAVRAHYSAEKNKDDDRFVNIKIEKDNWGIRTVFGNEKQVQVWADKIKDNEKNGRY